MVYQRMVRSVFMLFFAGLTFAACGSSEPETPQQKYCAALCKCNKCTPAESSTCNDDIVNLGEEASNAKCSDEYNTYLTCLNTDGICTDGAFDDSACYNEETDLHSCIKPPPPCATVNDGVCNEPPPAGNGTCDKGTDTKDCMVPPCTTTNNGICDEPQGTGTGLCAPGTDSADCPCTVCLTYAFDQSSGTLCTASLPLFSTLYDCACNTCLTDCGNTGDVCSNGVMSGTCFDCLQVSCTSEYTACSNDMGPP